MNKLFIFIFALSMIMVSCSNSSNTEKIIVASQQADCMGVAPQKCLLIKKAGQQDWEFLYSGIEGFSYEPGYEYEIEIRKEERKNPAADQSSIRYIFVKEISKERKTSDNLPPVTV